MAGTTSFPKEMELFKKAFMHMKEQITNLTTENQSLKKQIDDVTTENQFLKQTITNFKTKNQTLQQTNKTLVEKYAPLEKLYREVQSENQEYEQKIEDLKALCDEEGEITGIFSMGVDARVYSGDPPGATTTRPMLAEAPQQCHQCPRSCYSCGASLEGLRMGAAVVRGRKPTILRDLAPSDASSPINKFFDQFPKFGFDPLIMTHLPHALFDLLVFLDLDADDKGDKQKQYKHIYHSFFSAVTEEGDHFLEDSGHLAMEVDQWDNGKIVRHVSQRLTWELFSVFINIFDYIEHRRCPTIVPPPRNFENQRELAKYSWAADKVYPLEHAEDSHLKVLLHHLPDLKTDRKKDGKGKGAASKTVRPPKYHRF